MLAVSKVNSYSKAYYTHYSICRKNLFLPLFFVLSFFYSSALYAQTATDDFSVIGNVFGGGVSGTGWVNDSWVRTGANGNTGDVRGFNPNDSDDNIGGNLLQLDDNDAGAYRIVDLSGALSATLSFEYDYDNTMDGGEELIIRIDPENDGTYTTLQTIIATTNSPNPEVPVTITIPPSNLGGANTRILFITGSDNSINRNGEDWWIDNVVLSYTVGVDSDGDGVVDGIDLDDDNDGILDSVEKYGISTHALRTGGPNTVTTGPMSSMVIEVSSLDNSFNLTINGVTLVPVELQFYPQAAPTGRSLARFASDNTSHSSSGNSNIWNFNWNNGNPNFLLMRLIIDENGMVTLQGKRTVSSPLEDMVINAPDADFNTIPLNDTGSNVISFSQHVQGPTHYYSTVYARRILDTDADGKPDYLDLDSDNDGIPDNVEAQTTLGYTSPNADFNATYASNNGVNSAYLGGLTPVNTDGADNPDFRDTNTDNEGANDTTEAGLALSGVDVDNDGLDDAIDTDVSGYGDPGGTIDDPLNAPLRLLDTDTDANSGGNVDFRDATDNRPDNDLDGIVDALDFDDDNDGILDTDEGCGNLVINPSFEQQDFSDAALFPNGGTSVAGTFIGLNLNTNTLAGWNYTQNVDGWIEGQSPPWDTNNVFAQAYHGSQYIDVIGSNSQNGLNNTLTQTIPTEVGQTYTFSFFWGEDVGHAVGTQVQLEVAVIDSGNLNLISQTLTNAAEGIIANVRGPKKWYYFEQVFTATTTSTTIQFITIPDGPFNGAALDFVSVTKSGNCRDTDGDGIDDAYDLDSDNDGIYDAVEAGHGQAHTNGMVNGTVGTDGVPNTVQAAPNNETINYTISDSDSDLVYDAYENDSDNDSCSDTVEAGFTDVDDDGFLGTSPVTVDINGLVTGQGGYLIPADANTNTVYDFQEAGTAPAITTEPLDVTTYTGNNVLFSAVATNAVTYQWQLSTDGGSTFTDLSDGGAYTGTDTASLNIGTTDIEMNNYQYRLVGTNTAFVCSAPVLSRVTVLNVRVRTVITNRRITHRVNKD